MSRGRATRGTAVDVLAPGQVTAGVTGQGPTATWCLQTALPMEQANVHLAALEDAGLLGMAEEHGRAALYFPERVAGLPVAGTWQRVEERDWNQAWRAGLEPVTVGAVTIAPPWAPPADRDAPVRLVVEPAQAFGTGHHETTTGCLAALQDLYLRGRRVLDVGTGTGVLAIAAARLGAANVVAVDTDPLAVAAATENAARNDAAVAVRAGSIGAVGGRFDVVLANLDSDTLVRLAPELAAALAPGGTLVASGTSVERHADVVSALEEVELRVVVRRGRDWAVLVARPGNAQDPGSTNPGS